MKKVYVFKVFERFWHWSQATLILALLTTGFEIHGSYSFLGFGLAVDVHTICAWSLVALWIFAIFWHIVTGEWRQYIPTTQKIMAVIDYYILGIFQKDAKHPYKTTKLKKHNPLQRLAYIFILLVVGPIIWVSGWFYILYEYWPMFGLENLSLKLVATVHLLGAYAMAFFVIVHVYLITTGHTVGTHLKAMLTGYDES
jgi:thiosulfate reductase cytochrome b subunit